MRYNFEIYVGTVPYDQCWSNLWMDPDGNEYEKISDFLNNAILKDDRQYFPMSMEDIENSFLVDDPIPF
jgi:hypothetical protein